MCVSTNIDSFCNSAEKANENNSVTMLKLRSLVLNSTNQYTHSTLKYHVSPGRLGAFPSLLFFIYLPPVNTLKKIIVSSFLMHQALNYNISSVVPKSW